MKTANFGYVHKLISQQIVNRLCLVLRHHIAIAPLSYPYQWFVAHFFIS